LFLIAISFLSERFALLRAENREDSGVASRSCLVRKETKLTDERNYNARPSPEKGAGLKHLGSHILFFDMVVFRTWIPILRYNYIRSHIKETGPNKDTLIGIP